MLENVLLLFGGILLGIGAMIIFIIVSAWMHSDGEQGVVV